MIVTPSDCSASIMRAESSEWSGAIRRLGASASAERIYSRLVSDFDPGTVTVASIGPLATGADQWPRGEREGGGEYTSPVIGFYPTERTCRNP